MKTIFETCVPREEVILGEVKADIFAAKLGDVVANKAPDVYQNPNVFFDNTYPTDGLKTLLSEAFGRLSGVKPANSPVIRLETSFGGGKTHNLIALYHIAKMGLPLSEAKGRAVVDAARFIPEVYIPSTSIATAVLVGTDLDPSSGVRHNGIVTYTLWGELAYQLAGKAGYELMKANDTDKIAPGTDVLDRILEDKPALIMIDEIARYFRVARGVNISESNLADQMVAFLHTLFEFASSRKSVVVVYTLTESGDAYAKETEDIKTALREASKVSARHERVLRPSEETEIAHIVKRRLFKYIDSDATKEVADAYLDFLGQSHEQEVILPLRATKVEYRREIETSYPFHPELLSTLHRKTSTIPNFQKTRGALRLLALIVQQLWSEKPDDTVLIHPYHVDLSFDEIRNDLTSRLERAGFSPVIDADIVSAKGDSHAQEIDEDWKSKGKPPFATRIAQTIFLHSLTQTVAPGVDTAELNIAVGQPGVEFPLIQKTLEGLVDTCWYLDFDGRRYWFKTEASLNKIIEEEMDDVGRAAAKSELDLRILKIYQEKHFEPVFFPEEPDSIDDNAKKPKLVIIHYDNEQAEKSPLPPFEKGGFTDSPAPPLVKKLFERAGAQEGFRQYQNNLFFLVASKGEVENMIEQAQRNKALQRIANSPDRMREFNPEQRKKLEERRKASELDVRVAITKAYRHLFYPSAGAEELSHHTLKVQDASEAQKDQQAKVITILRNLKKALTSDDEKISADYAWDKVWQKGLDSITTEDLRKIFCRKRSLPIMLDPDQIKKTILDGIEKGVWVYYDGTKAFHAKTARPIIQLSDDHTLYTLDKAKELELLEPTEPDEEETKPDDDFFDEFTDEFGKVTKIRETPPLISVGTPNKAFETLKDKCADASVKSLSLISFETEGAQDSKSIGLVLPQLAKFKPMVSQDFYGEVDGDKLELKFSGSWDTFRTVKSLTEQMATKAQRAKVDINLTTKVAISFESPQAPESSDLTQIRDTLQKLNVGKIRLEGHAHQFSA